MTEDQKGRPRGAIRVCLSVIGVRRHGGKYFLLTRRFYVVVPILVALFLAGLGGFTYYSSTPGFCNSCHIMEPYVASWKASPHHEVSCVKCHFAPGWLNVVRGKLQAIRCVADTVAGVHVTKPNAEIEDDSCLREGCHERRLIEGEMLFQGKYAFDHGLHMGNMSRGKQLRCTDCHEEHNIRGKDSPDSFTHPANFATMCLRCHDK